MIYDFEKLAGETIKEKYFSILDFISEEASKIYYNSEKRMPANKITTSKEMVKMFKTIFTNFSLHSFDKDAIGTLNSTWHVFEDRSLPKGEIHISNSIDSDSAIIVQNFVPILDKQTVSQGIKDGVILV